MGHDINKKNVSNFLKRVGLPKRSLTLLHQKNYKHGRIHSPRKIKWCAKTNQNFRHNSETTCHLKMKFWEDNYFHEMLYQEINWSLDRTPLTQLQNYYSEHSFQFSSKN